MQRAITGTKTRRGLALIGIGWSQHLANAQTGFIPATSGGLLNWTNWMGFCIMTTENFSQFCLIGGQYDKEQGHLFNDPDGSIWFVFNFMGYTRDVLISK